MGRILWIYYPEQLVKIILKTELFKVSGNGPEGIQQMKKLLFPNISNNSGKNRVCSVVFQPWPAPSFPLFWP